jgi:hypothetical protein
MRALFFLVVAGGVVATILEYLAGFLPEPGVGRGGAGLLLIFIAINSLVIWLFGAMVYSFMRRSSGGD